MTEEIKKICYECGKEIGENYFTFGNFPHVKYKCLECEEIKDKDEECSYCGEQVNHIYCRTIWFGDHCRLLCEECILKLNKGELNIKNKKFNFKEEEDSYQLLERHKRIAEALTQLFEKKNKQYGSAFLKYGSVGLFIDMLRKWQRFENLFEMSKDKIETKEIYKELVIPCLSDLANYAILGLLQFSDGLNEEEFVKILNEIKEGE